MLRQLALDKNILFFGGKGGVGKTTLSAATALGAATAGQRVLLVSTDPAHNLGHLFNRTVGSKIVRLAENLDGLELDPTETVNEHLAEVTLVLRRLMPVQLADEVDKHMAMSRHAPGMEEAAMLERIAQVVEEASNYDLVVFDTAPSGHTARLMALPEMMSAWTEGLLQRRDKADKLADKINRMDDTDDRARDVLGEAPASEQGSREQQIRHILNRRRERFTQLRDTLKDEARTAFVIVLAAERLPVLETIELYKQLQEAGVPVAGLAVNKRIPATAQGFFAHRRELEDQHLDTLSQHLGQVPRQDIPLSEDDIVGLDALTELSKNL